MTSKPENLMLNGIAKPELTQLIKELFDKMRDAGCITVWFGVESGSEKVLAQMHKKINLSRYV